LNREAVGVATELPDGTKKPILSVPKYDFTWQTYYRVKEPLQQGKSHDTTDRDL
jgi:hypothetical protein